MGPRFSAILAALIALTAIRRMQEADYLWAALGFALAIAAAVQSYQLWKRGSA